MEYTDEYIKQLFDTSKTQGEIIEKLGKKRNGSSERLVAKLAKKIGVDLKFYGNRLTKDKYKESPNHCEYCGKELDFEHRHNKYCSSSCSAKANNSNRLHDTSEHKCLQCGNILSGDKKNNKFCSSKCCVDYHNKLRVEKWLNEGTAIRTNGQIPSFIKKYLMDLHDNKCEKCGWGKEHPITHNIPLEVHHIDGDCTNNKLENLQLLCPNCHCLTENFGSLNKNSKRFHRRKDRLDD